MPDQIKYRKNFLSEVIARIDFASPIHRIAKDLPSRISTAALKAFPIQEPRKAIAQHLQISQQNVTTENVELTEWHFFGKEREKQLVLVNESLFVTYTRYENYSSFRDDFLNILEVFFKDFPECVPNRLGLRYINKISIQNGDPFSWEEYINASLLSILNFSTNKTQISRAFSNLEFNHGDFNVRFQFGMHNPDFPAIIRQRHFILDYDAYHQGLQNPQDIGHNLDRYHEQIQLLFENSIKDSFRERLND